MGHLVFLPRPAGGPDFFLWESRPGRAGSGAIERLAAPGRRATVRVVTEDVTTERVSGLRIPLVDGVTTLAGFEAADLDRAPASLATWSLASKLALDLVARERILPLPRPAGTEAEARWRVSLALAEDADRFARLARAFPPSAHALPVDGEGPAPSRHSRRAAPKSQEGVQVWAPEALLAEFLDAVADALVRQASIRIRLPLFAGEEKRWEGRFLAALTEADPVFPIEGVLERSLLDELAEWVAPARGTLAVNTPRLCLKLDPPTEADRAKTDGAWRLAYFLQAPDDPSLLLPAERVWAAAGERLRWMDRTFTAPQEHLLRGLARAARLFPPIERSLEAARPEFQMLGEDDAWRFLSEAAPLLSEAGFPVLLPAELSPAGQRRLRLSMRLGGTASGVAGAVTAEGRLSLDSLVAYRWEVALGDHTLSPQEFRALVALKRPLVRWRGQWVVLDPNEVAPPSARSKRREAPGARRALGRSQGNTPPRGVPSAGGRCSGRATRLGDRATPGRARADPAADRPRGNAPPVPGARAGVACSHGVPRSRRLPGRRYGAW